MLPDSTKFLQDMLDCITAIQQSTHSLLPDDYYCNQMLHDSTRWNLAIIGEALTQLARSDLATAERIIGYRDIIGLRNRLIHGYGSIDDEIVWDIIVTHLPKLRAQLEQLLANPG